MSALAIPASIKIIVPIIPWTIIRLTAIMDDSALVNAFQSNVSEMMSMQHRTQGNATLSVLVLA